MEFITLWYGHRYNFKNIYFIGMNIIIYTILKIQISNTTFLSQAGKAFTDWQKDNQICYFPYQKNLTYFGTYSQDNCLLECRVKKISKRCGCTPWFVPKEKITKTGSKNPMDNVVNKLNVCTAEGNTCFEEKIKAYNEDLIDRTNCDCKNDCEMVHTFSTLQVDNVY